MNLPFIGQKARKQAQYDRWQEEIYEKLKAWEYENGVLVRPVLTVDQQSIKAQIAFAKMPEHLKDYYAAQIQAQEVQEPSRTPEAKE